MTDTPSRALPVGTRIGVYEIRRIVGVGQVGITYEAWNKHLNSRMVLKEYYPCKLVSRAADGCTVIPKPEADKTLLQSGLESFLAQAEQLMGLDHPNLVRVQNMLQLYGTAYQLMEYEHGVALSDLIARSETSLDEEQLKVIMSPILEALQQVHGAGFFHGDIHPGNILLKEDGSPILLEFAAARLAIAASSVQRSWVVTEGYAPAEQYDPERPMGSWTDLYGMGATMTRCITGEAPVSGPERLAALAKGAPDPQIPLQARAITAYSEGFLDCIDSMLNPVAEKRPPSAAAVLKLLNDGEQEQVVKDLKTAPKASAGAKDVDLTGSLRRISVPAMAGVGMGVVALITAGLWIVNQDRTVGPIQSQEISLVEMDEAKAHTSRIAAFDEQSSEQQDDTQGMGKDIGAAQEDVEETVYEHSEQQTSDSTEFVVAQIETADIDRKSAIPAETSVAPTEVLADDPVVLIDAQDVQAADEVVIDTPPDTVDKTEASIQVADIAQVQEDLGDMAGSSIASPSNTTQSQHPPETVINQIAQVPAEVQEGAGRMTFQQEMEVNSETQAADRIDVAADALVSVEQNVPDIPSVADETTEAVTDMVSTQQDAQQQEGVPEFVSGRMALAEQGLLALRLTTPQGNNAMEHYQDVLAVLPEHSGAMAGLQRIVELYTWMIDTALQKGQLAIAQLYLSRAQEVMPGAPSLLQAKQDLRSFDVEATQE